MAVLKLTVDDLQYAVSTVNAETRLPFGDRSWEASLLAQAGASGELSLGHVMLEWLVDGHPRLRGVLTLLFAPVYRALGYRLPLLTAAGYQMVMGAYPMRRGGAMHAELQADVFVGLDLMNTDWCKIFRTNEERELFTISQRYFLYYCARLLLSGMSDEKDESVDPEPEVPKSEDAQSTIHADRGLKLTFADVGGCHKAIEQLRDLVTLVRKPKIMTSSGISVPRGVLIWGPPGTGKDLLVKGFARETGYTLYRVRGSDIFDMWVGLSAKNMRKAFEQARKKGNAILCIDEADSIVSSRHNRHDSESTRQVVNEFLQQMDNFKPDEKVLVVLITNFRERLDEAAIRDKRIDWMIQVSMPDQGECEEIWQIHIQRVIRSASALYCPLAPRLDVSALGRSSLGLSGAAIASILEQAVLKKVVAFARTGTRSPVTQEDLERLVAERQSQQPKVKRIGFGPNVPR